MKNIYDGIVVCDVNGNATVHLPDWIEALNGDFRYQLCTLGQAASVYVASKLKDGHFEISGGKPGLEVCWQLTGIRKDAWARANSLPVEQEKVGREKGRYLCPELHGHRPDKSMHLLAQLWKGSESQL
jgi:hypothetical protein